MRTTTLDSEDDLQWLKDTHLRGIKLPDKWAAFQFAVLYGHESGPDAVDLYLSANPDVQDAYLKITLEPFNITEVS